MIFQPCVAGGERRVQRRRLAAARGSRGEQMPWGARKRRNVSTRPRQPSCRAPPGARLVEQPQPTIPVQFGGGDAEISHPRSSRRTRIGRPARAPLAISSSASSFTAQTPRPEALSAARQLRQHAIHPEPHPHPRGSLRVDVGAGVVCFADQQVANRMTGLFARWRGRLSASSTGGWAGLSAASDL